ncbi:MAG TPA: gamma-glutamyl-gamma-aminobutyrate hydrolase family protein [Gemmatimonadaceae bacterium]|nr:gamma-glutamyl-gamma-aminobutyrate hydrolase family protein [Gemmatimonadaceae bacterium]
MSTYPVEERSLVSSARKPVPACTVAVTASIRPDGETSRVRLTAAYVTALENAGLVPLIVPPLSNDRAAAAVLDSVSGLVLTGGEDVDPARYGEQRHEKVRSVNPARDATEAALVEEAKARGLPVLAICRGIQILNVALGGTLVQDISSQCKTDIGHDEDGPRDSRSHEISVEPGSLIAEAVGAEHLSVNSFHHQSVKRVADGMRVTARSPDGVIEGIESTDKRWWVMAVQWHPEEMTESPEPWDRGLFKAFARQLGV